MIWNDYFRLNLIEKIDINEIEIKEKIKLLREERESASPSMKESLEKTIKETLPDELKYLNSFDKAYEEINTIIEMPDNKIKSLITFILQNENKLSKSKREKYYQKLTDREVQNIEEIVEECFDF